MEKSKMVVKAEQQQQQQRDQGGSSSAADELALTVDLEALDCPICFHPLSPPVFQCAAGHVVCSACRDRLQGSGKCQVCSVTTVYGRCHAVERILRSVRVPCPNAARGCGVQTLLHEREEHEKECAHGHGAGQDGSSLSPTTLLLRHGLATVTISTAGHAGETKVVRNDKSARSAAGKQDGPVVKMGPCGGVGGDANWMDMDGVNRFVRVAVRHGNAVDATAVVYERDGRGELTGLWGGQGGKRSEFRLQPNEYLTSVEGHYGTFKGKLLVRSLKFTSNLRTYGPYGKEDGVPFELPAAGGRSSDSMRATVYSSTPLAPTSRWPTDNLTACCMNKTS